MRDQRFQLRGQELHALESWLGADLADVPIHTGPAAERLCAAMGARGLAVEGQVFLRRGPGISAVLRHELAHVVQQRRFAASREATPGAEAEARARTHMPGPILEAADPRIPACWEEVGHYYTTFAVLLATGVDTGIAARLAFYAQLADEMNALDAKDLMADEENNLTPVGQEFVRREAQRAGIEADDWAARKRNAACKLLGAGQRWAACYTSARATPLPPPSRDYSIVMDVHKGLHSLTGELCAVETEKRLAILRGLNARDTLAFGLALHAFGDSYAHRNRSTGRMFTPGTGHGLDSLVAKKVGNWTGEVHVDAIGPSKAKDYESYLSDLYMLASNLGEGVRGGERASRPTVLRTLMSIVAKTDAAADTDGEKDMQIKLIRAAANQWAPGAIGPWAPEKHGLSRLDKEGVLRLGGQGEFTVYAADLERALKLAGHWSKGSGNFLGAGAQPALPR